MADRIDDIWQEIRDLRKSVDGYRTEVREDQEATGKQIRRLSHESSSTRALLYSHLEDHSIEPDQVGCKRGDWNPAEYHPLVATERMQLHRHRNRLLVLLLVLLGSLIPKARPWIEQFVGAIR